MTQTLISLDKIGVSLGGRRVLYDVTMTIGEKKITTLVGPNGAGKTTLAQLIIGMRQPDQGHITKRPNLRIGYVPQKLPEKIPVPITVADILNLPAPSTLPKDFLSQINIISLLDKQAHTLSAGELQKVFIARAIGSQPHLLIMDEPTASIDQEGRRHIYELATTLPKRHNCALLMISHDMRLVLSASDQVICLNGHVCCSGKPETIVTDPAYTELFGTDMMGIYRHQHDHTHE